jgi:hypothetical protein
MAIPFLTIVRVYLLRDRIPLPLDGAKIKRHERFPQGVRDELIAFACRLRGDKTVPKPAAAPEPRMKSRIRAAYAAKVAELEWWLRRKFLRLRSEIGRLNLMLPCELGAALLSDMDTQLARRLTKFAHTYLPAAVEALRRADALCRFKHENDRQDEPVGPEHWLKPLARVNIFSLIDMGFSGPIFAAATEYGIIAGVLLAFVLNLVPITLGCALVGFVGLRLAVHVKFRLRILGWSCVGVGTSATGTYILVLAQWRALLHINPTASLKDAAVTLWLAPWTFADSVEAVLLVALSFAMFIVAVHEGRNGFADRYWGYLNIADRAATSQADAQAIVDQTSDCFDAICKDTGVKAETETTCALQQYDDACDIAERALQVANDCRRVDNTSRATAELLSAECDALVKEFGFAVPAAALPAPMAEPQNLPAGCSPHAPQLPPADLLQACCNRREEVRHAGRELPLRIQSCARTYETRLHELKRRLDAKAREIVDAPFWQPVDWSAIVEECT